MFHLVEASFVRATRWLAPFVLVAGAAAGTTASEVQHEVGGVLRHRAGALEVTAVRVNGMTYATGGPVIEIRGREPRRRARRVTPAAGSTLAHGAIAPTGRTEMPSGINESVCRQSVSLHVVLHNAGPTLASVTPRPLVWFELSPAGIDGGKAIVLPLANGADAEVDLGEFAVGPGTYALQLQFTRTEGAPAVPEGVAATFVLAVKC